jgi:hypothetical protein
MASSIPSSVPDAADPARRRLGRLLAGAALLLLLLPACDGGAPKLRFGVSPAEHDAYFPIATGTHALERAAADGPISCTSCHGSDGSFAAMDCRGCHEHRQEAMDATHAGLERYRFEAKACLTCHARGDASEEISAADHSALYFPIADGDAHHAERCTGCHTSPQDRRAVTCVGCHAHDAQPMASAHGEMADYVWDTTSCRTCHARAENPGQRAHPAFPTAATDVHGAVRCTECHASARDRSELACTTCHAHEEAETTRAHQGVPDFAYDSGSCVLCHRAAQVPGELNHTFFPVGAPATHALGATIDDPPVTVACATCHVEPTTRAAVSCTQCHAHGEEVLAATHTGVNGYAWTESGCLFCHPNGEPTGVVDHPQFPIANGAVHAGIACTDCHASRTDPTQVRCAGCHTLADTEPVHRGMPSWRFDSAACRTCHPQAEPVGLFDHEAFFPLRAPSGNGRHAALTCRDCHADPTRRTEVACTTCHLTAPGEAIDVHGDARLTPLHAGVTGFTFSSTSCVTCHPDGTADNAVFAHPQFPIGAGAVHEVRAGGAQCADCHTTPGDNSVVTCTACHTGTHDEGPMVQTHRNVAGFQWTTSQCLFCHPNGEGAANIDHEPYFPIAPPAAHAGVACGDCHLDDADRSVLGCAECHAADPAPPATVHAGIDGFVDTSVGCRQCHGRAENPGDMDHDPYFPVEAGSAHGGSAFQARVAAGQNRCQACHASRADRSTNTCAQCHAGVSPVPSSAHGQVRGFQNQSPSCKACHGDAQIDRLSQHSAFSPRHEGARCTQCHRQTRADKPWAIDFDRADCVACHSSSCTPSNRGACDD